jgi:hypothetical protein
MVYSLPNKRGSNVTIIGAITNIKTQIYYNITNNMLKGKKNFVINEDTANPIIIDYNGTFRKEGKTYSVFTINDKSEKKQQQQRFRVSGGVDALLANDVVVDVHKIERLIMKEERYIYETPCSIQGGASRRLKANRRGKQRRTRRKTCRRLGRRF